MRHGVKHKVREWIVAIGSWQVVTLLPRSDIWPKKWSCRCSAFAILTSEQGGQLVDLVLARQVLREEVRRVDFPSDLSHRYRTSPDLLLYPQGMGLEMSQFPETGPSRNS